nr:MAG TPA: hypothetical protein [Caudoviricetes sp.]
MQPSHKLAASSPSHNPAASVCTEARQNRKYLGRLKIARVC